MVYVFLRNDDVFRIDERFLEYHKILMREGVPVVYAIIPGKINRETVSFLKAETIENPERLDFSQHGWMHKNHGKRIKYEFGYSRTYSQQRHDILRGRRIMHKMFGSGSNSIFVPPHHQMNKDTFRIINEMGFNGISVSYGSRILKGKKVLNMPVHIKLDDANPEKYRSVVENINKWSKRIPIIGILTHHEKIKDMKSFERTIKLLKTMEKKGMIRFTNFSNILRGRKRASENRDV